MNILISFFGMLLVVYPMLFTEILRMITSDSSTGSTELPNTKYYQGYKRYLSLILLTFFRFLWAYGVLQVKNIKTSSI